MNSTVKPNQQINLTQHFEYILRIGDSVLILGHRLSEWCGHSPVIEEDLAITNVALDLIGQARALLSHAASIEGNARDEDQLAYLRSPDEIKNVTIVELPNEHFGVTILRNFLFLSFQRELWKSLKGTSDHQLAAISQKALIETQYHLGHSSNWVVRLGDGTDESNKKMQSALDYLWPYTMELFQVDDVDHQMASKNIAPMVSLLRDQWLQIVNPILDEANLRAPENSSVESKGKFGQHTEHLTNLLDEMQYLQKTFPGGSW